MTRAGGLLASRVWLAIIASAAITASTAFTASAVFTASAGSALAQAPSAPVYFEYRLTQEVVNGGGVYEGWSDRLTATGRYEIEERGADSSVRARYRWQYRSPDDVRTGDEDRRVAFDATSRRYAAAPIDLDDYDDRPASPGRAIWWRIPTDVAVGSTVQILDETFVVVGPVPPSASTRGRPSLLLEQTGGVGTRNDAYGDYATTFVDRYWFDAETGYFLREVFEEHDVGTLDGDRASFDVAETVEVSAASYLPGSIATYESSGGAAPGSLGTPSYRPTSSGALRMLTESAPYWGLGLIGVGALMLVLRRRRKRDHDFEGTLEAITAANALPSDAASQTAHFGELLPHLVKQNLHAGFPVWIAKSSLGTAGVALGAPVGEASTIFARDTAACEALRRKLDADHFFSEVRHEHAFAARVAANQSSVALSPSHAYNVLETHEVLTLSPIPGDASYDRSIVRRSKPEDVPAVIALADAVYGTSTRAWIEAALATGDVLLVATVDGQIAGFAMVSVSGATARFHGLTVRPEARGKGLGKELNRARVRVSHDLGAERAIVEVAAWNVASLEVAKASGFRGVGQMFVETASATPVDRKFRRR